MSGRTTTFIAILAAATLASCSRKDSLPTAPSPNPSTAMTVTATTPTSGASDVAVITSFSATLSSAIDAATATAQTFTVGTGGSYVTGRVTTVGTTVTFTPLVPLSTGAAYTATLTTGIKDQNGQTLASNFSWSVTTQAGQPLGGILSASTTVTLANSPYVLTQDIQIAYGATLTIEPGVVIDGSGRNIKVHGALNAVGTPSAPITFLDCGIDPGNNAQAEPYSIMVQHATLWGGTFYRATGNAVYGSVVLRDSRAYGLTGVFYLWYPVADCTIERNVFVSCGGISVGVSDDVNVYVRNNVFYQQTTEYAIENWASYSTSEVVVARNSFLSTDRVALSLPKGYSSSRMTATHNYWGTANTATIDAMIFDQRDDLASAAMITYQPFLTSPDVATPDATPWTTAASLRAARRADASLHPQHARHPSGAPYSVIDLRPRVCPLASRRRRRQHHEQPETPDRRSRAHGKSP